MPNSLKCRLKKFVHKGLLSEKDLSRLYTDNDVIEELEKINEEIHDIKLELDCDYYTGDKITRLIEKHIAELKGENK